MDGNALAAPSAPTQAETVAEAEDRLRVLVRALARQAAREAWAAFNRQSSSDAEPTQ